MRFIEFLIEAGESIGAVVSVSNGRFYDINFVDYDTLRSVSGHNANMGRRFIEFARDRDAWEDVFPFFKQSFRGKPLGEEYSSEDADFYLFGPMTPNDLSTLTDNFARFIGET